MKTKTATRHDPMKTVVIMATFPSGEQVEEFAIVKDGRVYPFGPDNREALRQVTERIAARKDAIEDYHNYNLNEVKYRILREVTL